MSARPKSVASKSRSPWDSTAQHDLAVRETGFVIDHDLEELPNSVMRKLRRQGRRRTVD